MGKYNVFSTKAGFKPDQPRDEDGKWTDGPRGEFDDSALEYYTFSDMDAEKVNRCLRDPDCNDEFLLNNAKVIDDSLTHLDPYDGITFRGIDLYEDEYKEFMDNIRSSSEIEFKAFMSTSPDTGVVESFAFQGNKSIIFTLHGKSGRDISKYSVYGSDETEVLFGKGTKWRIGKVMEDIKFPSMNRRGRIYTDIELFEI